VSIRDLLPFPLLCPVMTTRWPSTRYKIMFGVPAITGSRIPALPRRGPDKVDF
jgi:hypothetical protein